MGPILHAERLFLTPIQESDVELFANPAVVQCAMRQNDLMESLFLMVFAGSKRLDPNANDYCNFWNNPRFRPPSVDW